MATLWLSTFVYFNRIILFPGIVFKKSYNAIQTYPKEASKYAFANDILFSNFSMEKGSFCTRK